MKKINKSLTDEQFIKKLDDKLLARVRQQFNDYISIPKSQYDSKYDTEQRRYLKELYDIFCD
jgi:hypothetical protein